MAKNDYLKEAFQKDYDPEVFKQIADAGFVKQLLTYCSYVPNAKINIEVIHDNGQRALLSTYDNAALVQGLYDALEDFISDWI